MALRSAGTSFAPTRHNSASSPTGRARPPLKILCKSPSTCSVSMPPAKRMLPILLFDVMDTLVRDPFYHDVPVFFGGGISWKAIWQHWVFRITGMTFKELINDKHPNAWFEFEKGLINEMELAEKFFKDGRSIDLEGLKECMRNGYGYLDGIEALLQNLKQNDYEIHAFTNYPIWYTMIEEKLKLSTYLSWTFCSCNIGKRKPAQESFLEVSYRLGVDPKNCIFIDDRIVNVEAARSVGMVGLHFKNATSLQQDLSKLGVRIHVMQS